MYSLHKTPLGIYEKALPDSFSWEEKMLSAKKAGFDYMEISIDESDARLDRLDWTHKEIRQLRDLIIQTGIPIPTMCLSGHRRFPFGSKNPAIRQKAYEIMEKAILFSTKLGIRCIQLAAYDVYYEEADAETEALFLAGMRDAVSMAAKAGVILAMEIMDTPFMGTIVRALRYIRQIPSPYFKIYPDIGNLSNFSSNPGDELELGLEQIAAIHVKETKPGVFRDVPFGTGQVDFQHIFRILKEIGYNGMFLVEMWASPTVTSMEEAVTSIAEARTFVLTQMKAAGWPLESLGRERNEFR